MTTFKRQLCRTDHKPVPHVTLDDCAQIAVIANGLEETDQ